MIVAWVLISSGAALCASSIIACLSAAKAAPAKTHATAIVESGLNDVIMTSLPMDFKIFPGVINLNLILKTGPSVPANLT